MTVQPTSRKLAVVSLFGFALVWIALMAAVTWLFGGRASAGIAPVDDGSVVANITTLDRGKDFDIALSLKLTDKSGKVLEGLAERDIDVYEDGQLVHSQNFAPAGQGAIRLALVVDYSSSMNGRKITEARRAARALIRMLRDQHDYVGLYLFNDPLFDGNRSERLPVAPLTLMKREDAWESLMFTGLGNGSPMLGTMKKAIKSLEGVSGRRVLILLTDGMETGEPAEIAADKAAVLAAAGEARVPLYAVNLSTEFTDEQMLRELADKSGGQYVGVPSPDKLKDIFETIGRSLQSEYTLNYVSPNPVEDGLKRKVTVNVRNGLVGTQAFGEYNVPGVISTGAATQRTGGGSFLGTVLNIGTVFGVLSVVLGVTFCVPLVMRSRPSDAASMQDAPAPAVNGAKPTKPQAKQPGAPSAQAPVRKPGSHPGITPQGKKPPTHQGLMRRPGLPD